eukprot:1116064_1
MSTRTLFIFLLVSSNCNPHIPTYNKFCASHSVSSDVDGTFEYSYSNWTANGSVYYNNEIDQYLFPWVEHHDTYTTTMYIIGKDPTEFRAHSYCLVSGSHSFDPSYCTNGWISYHKSRQNWTDDTNMRLTNCNDICITGNTNSKSYVYGTYIWSGFDLSSDASIYNNTMHSEIYLSTRDHTHWNVYNQSSNAQPISETLRMQTCASSCKNGIQTPYYGVMKPNKDRTMFNQGRIDSIVSWSVYNDTTSPLHQSIGNFQYKSNHTNYDSCPSFILDTDDYIHGYRVIYDEHVFGLTFYTFNGKMYNCNASDLNYSQYHDSGVIYDNDYYLSGFSIYVEWVIDAISFQFTSIHNCTDSPTTDPTFHPSVFPSDYPSINPTFYPSMEPSIAPTIEPTFNPTQHPLFSRILVITKHPTSTPTILHGMMVSFCMVCVI